MKDTPYMERIGWRAAGGPYIPPNTSRKIASAFYQLKLGQGYFKAYLERFHIVQDASCKCGHWKQDPQHLLIHCTLYKAQRRKVRGEMQGPLTLGLMLGTKKGIQLTIQFLKETNISTKEWHRSNMELGKEEEGEREEIFQEEMQELHL